MKATIETPFPSGIAPMLVAEQKRLIPKPSWNVEFKLDGHRAIAYVPPPDKPIRVNSRDNTDARSPGNPMRMNEIPHIYAALASIQGRHTLVFDGEVVVARKKKDPQTGEEILVVGNADTVTGYRQRKNKGVEFEYFAIFDLLYCDGENTMRWPQQKRKEKLEQILGEIGNPFLQYVQHQEVATPELNDYLSDVQAGNIEGLVLKNPNTLYFPGRRLSKVSAKMTYPLTPQQIELSIQSS